MLETLELQAERIVPELSRESALPVCLSENPYRLVSLWSMLQFSADAFVKLMSDLEETERILISDPAKILDPTESQRMAYRIAHAMSYCALLGLSSATKQVRRINDRVGTGKCTTSELKGLVAEFRTRIIEDCENKAFFSVTDSRDHR